MTETSFQSLREIKKSIGIYYIGVSLVSSSMYAVTNLQSSLNIKSGLGVTSLAVWGVGISVTSIVCSQVLFRFMNARMMLVLSDIGSLTYILANFYPVSYTLLPSSAIFGSGRALFWISSSLFNVFFATKYAEAKKGNFTKYFSYVNGCFFGAFVSGEIFGNLIPFLIFSTSSSYEDDFITSTILTTTQLFSNMTYSQAKSNRSSVKDNCGVHDCQDPSVVANNISNYQPPSKRTLYLVLGILTGLHCLAIALHAIFLPFLKDTALHSSKCDQCHAGVSNNSYVFDNVEEDTNNNEGNSTITSTCDTKTSTTKNSFDQKTAIRSLKKRTVKLNTKQQNPSTELFTELKKTFQFFFEPKLLLLTILFVQVGFNQGFVISEITRAYVSCVYGVEQVGIAMSIYGTSFLLSSIGAGKISATVGRKVGVSIGCFVNCTVYLFCLFWIPDKNSNIGIIYTLLLLCGVCDALNQTITAETAVIYFPNDTKPAYACWVFWTSVGFVLQYSWSTSVCVRHKLYAMFFTLFVGVATFSIAEYKFSQERLSDITKKRNINTIA